MAERHRLRLGMLGGGGFGHFAVREFMRLPGVELVALAETRREASQKLAKELGIPLFREARELVQMDAVDMVYVATPPFLHHEHVLAALAAGKHVLCEKPLALSLEQADEMLASAEAKGLVLVTNLMQRYGAFYEPVRAIVERGWLGAFLHGSLENYASDEGLSDQHWFWDKQKSGGIFVEHGVHFFDLFAGWFGEGRVISAQRSLRARTGFEDQVSCVLSYPRGATVSMYHGFTQPSSLDRLSIRLAFEHGEVLLDGWIPTTIRIRGLVGPNTAHAIASRLPEASIEVLEEYTGDARRIRSHGQVFEAAQRVEIVAGAGTPKSERYGQALRALLLDQMKRIRNPDHERIVSGENGRTSLAVAVEASRLAETQRAAQFAVGPPSAGRPHVR